ncbi:hypothetical protein E5F05_15015 [Deinococcus metallilatus]|uniref:CHRD domain-containing protein n=1 Tax=Deinococcus metallilatus TaxID=1211322 RepID=A0AAJ5F1H1_9DEIO|nr:hypothetical protein [Deinococcus metallilatus]MBB5296782.1 hypothetical protein [Deinococcus metallilatus]QBY09151.1 hypothetical protein E5F05_15015 [Deinococcus metallilatus]RXJ09666.1 hypothetical protein ERJ73_13845 [Deinococcus metallilatus]TLK24132.1 hypothetical protein FCS05_14805 [Deinococcus metallilatus]GMA13812.1 hypothetical protein GCM10025871_01430 [Deinococcus metallilatus]
MRRAWLLPLAAALLSACGDLAAPPAPTAGDLLGAPTSLQVTGRSLKAEATPTLDGTTLNVRVRVQPSRAPLPPLTLTGVYVVTEDGVWSAVTTRGESQDCGANSCLQGTGRGAARGLRPGEGVQVVVSLKDAQGRTMWLRDPQANIQQN